MHALIQNENEIQDYWHSFQNVLHSNKHVFQDKLIDYMLFVNIYKKVRTRAFNYGVHSVAMIPMADNLNHNSSV